MAKHFSKLYVLWTILKPEPPNDSVVLSFLSPVDEARLAKRYRIIVGRQFVQRVKPEAVDLYRELVARIGAAPAGEGQTLRQWMTLRGRASRWWYHPVAARDSESGVVFDTIVQTLAIQLAAADAGACGLVLHGPPVGQASILRTRFKVETYGAKRPRGMLRRAGYGLGSRTKYLFTYLSQRRSLARTYRLPPNKSRPLAFVSFWDWAFKRDTKSHTYNDRYFKRLPRELSDLGVSSIYFAWFDPHMEPGQEGRDLSAVLLPLQGTDEVVILQVLLAVSDVLKSLADFRPLRVLHRALNLPGFRMAFCSSGWDWLPVFRPELLDGCWNASIPNCELVALATERAARRYRPRLTVGFLEHFLHARAHYEGMRRSSVGAANWAVQHAGVCREKTFYFLHPEVEFRGGADKVSVPHPDRVFVMGEIGEKIFRECGYIKEQVSVTGSTRYDHVHFSIISEPVSAPHAGARVLLACSLEIETEIMMVEAASCAARDVPGLTLRLRNHPSSRVDSHPRFSAFASYMEISSFSLAEDLAWADLIIFSYSTVAEEAYLQGRPVWQWLPIGFNGSALVEAVQVPQFGSAAELREALRTFVINPHAHVPNVASRAEVARKLFHPADGRAAARIAVECALHLNSPRSFHG